MTPMHYGGDTIAAVATPAGTGAVALVRLSGPGSWGVAEAVFRGKGRLAARRVVYGDLVDEEGWIIDDVLVTAFRGPARPKSISRRSPRASPPAGRFWCCCPRLRSRRSG
jgi:glycine cleavage system aminomethyltransferase T